MGLPDKYRVTADETHPFHSCFAALRCHAKWTSVPSSPGASLAIPGDDVCTGPLIDYAYLMRTALKRRSKKSKVASNGMLSGILTPH